MWDETVKFAVGLWVLGSYVFWKTSRDLLLSTIQMVLHWSRGICWRPTKDCEYQIWLLELEQRRLCVQKTAANAETRTCGSWHLFNVQFRNPKWILDAYVLYIKWLNRLPRQHDTTLHQISGLLDKKTEFRIYDIDVSPVTSHYLESHGYFYSNPWLELIGHVPLFLPLWDPTIHSTTNHPNNQQ